MKRFRDLFDGVDERPQTLAWLHLACGAVCVLLVTTTVWLYRQPNAAPTNELALPMPVGEAVGLVASAVKWQGELTVQREAKNNLKNEVAEAIKWLPRAHDWSTSMGDIQQLADQCEVLIAAGKPGDHLSGSRIETNHATVQLEGSYHAVCRFLAGLTRLERPIWASELTMRTNAAEETLSVVASLRIPAAGQRSPAAYLYEQRQRDSLVVALGSEIDE